ncbi:hypothetical protein [Micromonospora noduli]|uniref:hypothetical protein n=1 Tax=Micromonospora noduli TaxID=709876 RepID=UPI0011BF46A2|nr:hypothetical protein [Micromonospora noduli]
MEDRATTERTGPPSVIVFELPTARRVGAQLRAGGGPQLDQIRQAVQVLTTEPATNEDPPDSGAREFRQHRGWSLPAARH